MRLRFDEITGMLKLTCPWRTSRRTALAWALDQQSWIEAQLAARRHPEPFRPGALVPVEGSDVRIVWQESWQRTPQLVGAELRCGGPETGLSRRVESFLKAHARRILSQDVSDFAAAAGVWPKSVSVGDPATRWGSCSSKGGIRLSWRLIMAPVEARRFVAAHEVAHLRHLNHGPEFKELEARLFGPGLAEAKLKLRRVGPRLRSIGRSA